MNLTTDPWIPIVSTDGTAGLGSLVDVFQRGRDISDLAVRPHERVALMRLLLCVSHAALDGPADHEDWQTCLDRLPSAAAKYLAKWRASFELYGEGPRFQQWMAKSDPTLMSVHKLVFVDKDSATLFNHDATPDTALQARILALALVTFQSFAAGGRVEGSADSLKAGLCRQGSALHCFIRRDSVLATIHANLLTKDQVQGLAPLHWGKPLWEFRALSAEDLMPHRREIICGYLSRLAPGTRCLWIQEDTKSVAAYGGLSFSGHPDMREPTTTIVRNKKGERSVVPGRVHEAPWRELHSLMVRRATATDVGGPLAFENLDSNCAFDIWTGALAGDQAKVVDTIEAVYHVPAAMLQTTGQRCYEQGVKFAEDVAWRLSQAVSTYHREIGDSLDRPEARDRREKLRDKTAFQFWTQVERNVPLLLGLRRQP